MKKSLLSIFLLFVLVANNKLFADIKEDFENLQRFVQWGDVEETKNAIKKNKAAVKYNNSEVIIDAANTFKDPEILKMLLNAGGDPNALQANTNQNALHIILYSCVDENQPAVLEAVKLLVAKGINLNQQRNEDGYTPLHIAAKNEYIQKGIFEALLQSPGVDVKIKCKQINDLEDGAWVPLFFVVTRANDLGSSKDIAKLLIDKDPASVKYTSLDKDPVIRRNYSALHWCCNTSGDHVDIAQLLVEAGSDIELMTTNEKFSPLHVAMLANNAKICQMLLEKGASYKSKNVDGVDILAHSLAFGRRMNFESAEVIIKWAETHK